MIRRPVGRIPMMGLAALIVAVTAGCAASAGTVAAGSNGISSSAISSIPSRAVRSSAVRSSGPPSSVSTSAGRTVGGSTVSAAPTPPASAPSSGGLMKTVGLSANGLLLGLHVGQQLRVVLAPDWTVPRAVAADAVTAPLQPLRNEAAAGSSADVAELADHGAFDAVRREPGRGAPAVLVGVPVDAAGIRPAE
jgi:hypothetical protein